MTLIDDPDLFCRDLDHRADNPLRKVAECATEMYLETSKFSVGISYEIISNFILHQFLMKLFGI